MLSDLNEAKAALEELVVAEKKIGMSVFEVVVGVAGSHLKSQKYKRRNIQPTPIDCY